MRRCANLPGHDLGATAGKCAKADLRPSSHGLAVGFHPVVALFARYGSRREADYADRLLSALRFQFDRRVGKRKAEV